VAVGLTVVGILFLLTGIGGLLASNSDNLWFSIAWIVIGAGFLTGAAMSGGKRGARH
jgi:hypothetical protein